MTRRFLALMTMGAAMAVAPACGLPLDILADEIANVCDSDDACGANGRCIDGTCVATDADLTGLLLTITVPDGSRQASGTTSVVFPDAPLSGQRGDGFYIHEHTLQISSLSSVSVRLALGDPPAACAPLLHADGTYPIEVQLTQKIRDASGTLIDGVPLPTYQTTSDATVFDTNEASSKVPIGTYDIYVVPRADPAHPDCRLPPTFLSNQDLLDGAVTFDVAAGLPALLPITISNMDVTGWTLDMVENGNGRVISTKLSLEGQGEFMLEHWPQVLDSTDPVVRLVPPEGVTHLPTILAKLEALDIFGTGQNTIDLLELSTAQAVTLTGNLVSEDAYDALPGQLIFQSTQLIGGKLGDIAIFRNTVDTEADGSFSTSVLWGSYDVIALPNSDSYAVTLNEVEVSSMDEGGKTVFAKPKRRLEGKAVTPTLQPAYNVQVSLSPTTGASTSFLTSKLATTMQGSPGATVTDSAGEFSLFVDPGGVFNLLLRPEADSNLPWALMSNLSVSTSNEQIDQVKIQISNPVVMTGSVRGADDSIPHAIVRAYIQPESTGPVVQIGETTADHRGAYELRLPATIASYNPL